MAPLPARPALQELCLIQPDSHVAVGEGLPPSAFLGRVTQKAFRQRRTQSSILEAAGKLSSRVSSSRMWIYVTR